MEKQILKSIINDYNICSDATTICVKAIAQYPHVFRIECPERTLIAKKIDRSKLHCQNVDELYKDLSKIGSIHTPLRTADGNYSFDIDGIVFFIYRELQETKEAPTPEWWAKCLSSIHRIDQSHNCSRAFHSDFYQETRSLLASANRHIKGTIASKIYGLMDSISEKRIADISKFTLCHNDPHNLNVMNDGDTYKLIDTECMGLSPKEYDIQRMLYNYALNAGNELEIIEFWGAFKHRYEELSASQIDMGLLKDIYKLDFIRSLSWLYLVTNDLDRFDRQRQMYELDLFNESIDNNIHVKLLGRI